MKAVLVTTPLPVRCQVEAVAAGLAAVWAESQQIRATLEREDAVRGERGKLGTGRPWPATRLRTGECTRCRVFGVILVASRLVRL